MPRRIKLDALPSSFNVHVDGAVFVDARRGRIRRPGEVGIDITNASIVKEGRSRFRRARAEDDAIGALIVGGLVRWRREVELKLKRLRCLNSWRQEAFALGVRTELVRLLPRLQLPSINLAGYR